MEFISANEFLKQDEKVQKVFLNWWEKDACSYDLLTFKNDREPRFYCDLECNEVYEDLIPLLTEGQLRKFIEDKTALKLEITQFEDGEWNLSLYKNGLRYIEIDDMNLLQAYWKVAIQIAEQL